MELKIEEISYDSILKKMNLTVVDGKLAQYEPTKKNVYFHPEVENKIIEQKTNIPPVNPQIQRQMYIKFLINKINQKKRIAKMKPKQMFFT